MKSLFAKRLTLFIEIDLEPSVGYFIVSSKTLTPWLRTILNHAWILQNPPVHFWKHALIFKMHHAFSLIFHIQHLWPVLLAR